MDKKVVTDKVIMSIFKLCMAVVFTFQAYLSVHKCLQKKVLGHEKSLPHDLDSLYTSKHPLLS